MKRAEMERGQSHSKRAILHLARTEHKLHIHELKIEQWALLFESDFIIIIRNQFG